MVAAFDEKLRVVNKRTLTLDDVVRDMAARRDREYYGE
jgi:hypothetical protein